MVTVRRGLVVFATAVLALLLAAAPAFAHVEVRVEPAQAGARDAVVTFAVAAESGTAGISSVLVQLPGAIDPGAVALTSGPPGWALAPSPDGYTVAGPPLAVGEDVGYAITVEQLPDVADLAFKTVVSYTDGTADRWIDLPAPGGAEPENPAPVATLDPPVPTSVTSSPAGPAPSTGAAGAQPARTSGSGGLPVWVWAGVAAVVVLGAASVVVLRRRSGGGSGG